MILLVYFLIAVAVFFTALVYWARWDAANAPSRDWGDYFLFGLMITGLSLMWPVSIFAMLSVLIFRHFRMKADREREITRELSRG